ncbi:MAG: hypothetical protein V1649_01420 [Patescibacteria group bacterium]
MFKQVLTAVLNQGIDQFTGPLVKKIPKSTLLKLKEMQAHKALPFLSIIFSSFFPGDKSRLGNTLNRLIAELTSELSEEIGEKGGGKDKKEDMFTKEEIVALLLNPRLREKLDELLLAFTDLFENKGEEEKEAIWAVLGQLKGTMFLELLDCEKLKRDKIIDILKVKVSVKEKVSFQQKLHGLKGKIKELNGNGKVFYDEIIKLGEDNPVVQSFMSKMCQRRKTGSEKIPTTPNSEAESQGLWKDFWWGIGKLRRWLI